MLFNSIPFLVFIAGFVPLYFLTKGRLRLLLCLVASYLFYAWWDWRFLSLIIISTVVDYVTGRLLGGGRSAVRGKRLVRPRVLLGVSVCVNLGLLGFFKYWNFFIDSLAGALQSCGVNPNMPALGIILPVGISFYTFQTMSYTIDVYRGKAEVEKSFLRFATFVAFFPQLVAGPIVRASTLLPQLKNDHPPRWDRLVSGFSLILWGYVLKIVVADSLAPVVESRFGAPANHSSLSLLIGVVFYAFQIYGDFCGYSSIAIGVGRVLGFDFGINFDRPYFSHSFSEFWRRWHISLSSWLRDYLYIPLGGSEKGALRTLLNLVIVMFLGGLWHGAHWTFVAWGLMHGVFLAGQRALGPPFKRLASRARVPKMVSATFLVLLVFSLTCLAWVFFRAQSFEDAFTIIERIAALDGRGWRSVPNLFLVVKGVFLIVVLVFVEWLSFRVDFAEIGRRYPIVNGLFVVLCLYGLALFGTFEGASFIYFQF